MATSDKDFKVKNGIQVAGDAIIAGNISAAAPTASGHVATKGYVDSLALPAVDSTAPSSPSAGQLWLDTVSLRLHVYDGSSWITLATKADADYLPDHIHDTAIDGTGRISTTFVEGGTPTTTFASTTEAGSASTTDWDETWSGGIVVDNFN
jgi:hypothetical protein